MKGSLLRSPEGDKAGLATPENVVQQVQGQDVHSTSGNNSSNGDVTIHAHYPDQVRAVSAWSVQLFQ